MIAQPSLFAVIETPFGPLCAGLDDGGVLLELWLPNRKTRHRNTDPSKSTRSARTALNDLQRQLAEYFDRKRRVFDVAMRAQGTAFERRVWRRLCDIPFGSTASYGSIAQEFGLENGARAIGRANGANPIPVVIPCHRVIGADGSLVGFGGGLALKQALLEHEGALVPQAPRLF